MKQYIIIEEEVELIEEHLNNEHCKPCPYEGGGIKSGIKSILRSREYNPDKPRPPCEECIYQKQSAEYDRATRNAALKELKTDLQTRFIYRSGVMRGTGRPPPLGRGRSPPSSSCTVHVSR